MTVPTDLQLFGLADATKLPTIMSNFGLETPNDPRVALQFILTKLVAQYNEFILNDSVSTYGATVQKVNSDLNTQRQTYTIFLDMNLEVSGAAAEPE